MFFISIKVYSISEKKVLANYHVLHLHFSLSAKIMFLSPYTNKLLVVVEVVEIIDVYVYNIFVKLVFVLPSETQKYFVEIINLCNTSS